MKAFKTIQIILLLCLQSLLSTGVQAEGTLVFYHNDAFNNPIAATDIDGNILWKERYAPFGEPQVNETAKEAHPVDYTGHVYDKELGLHYMGARYYDPILGRFMGNDPVGFYESNPVSFNRYAYANNNPYRYFDPDGKVPLDTLWDFGNVVYDIGKISVGWAIGDQRMVIEGGKDLLADGAALLVPYVPAGVTKVDDAAKAINKNVKPRGLAQNRNLRDLTHQDLTKVFKGSGFSLSGHAIKRLKEKRTEDLGFKTPNDIAKIFNKGKPFDAGNGEIGFSFRGLEAIVNPKTRRVVTFRPAKNRTAKK